MRTLTHFGGPLKGVCRFLGAHRIEKLHNLWIRNFGRSPHSRVPPKSLQNPMENYPLIDMYKLYIYK